MCRHELTDEEWASIKSVLPSEKPRRGRPWISHRLVISGILWVITAGAPWRDLPSEFGKWKTVYNRFRRWTREGLWDRLWKAELRHLDATGTIKRDQWNIDGTIVRAHRCASGAGKPDAQKDPKEPADHALGQSRGGFTTKVHLAVDSEGHSLGVVITAGQVHESTQFEDVIRVIPLVKKTTGEDLPDAMAGDKAYSSGTIRNWLEKHDVQDVIPTRDNESRRPGFNKRKYKRRNIIERVIGWLKECRRVATRYEKKATHFLAVIKIAMLRLCWKNHLRDSA